MSSIIQFASEHPCSNIRYSSTHATMVQFTNMPQQMTAAIFTEKFPKIRFADRVDLKTPIFKIMCTCSQPVCPVVLFF